MALKPNQGLDRPERVSSMVAYCREGLPQQSRIKLLLPRHAGCEGRGLARSLREVWSDADAFKYVGAREMNFHGL